MADTLSVINKQITSVIGQPLPGVSVAVLVGDINGASPVDATTQPGSPLATIYADPQGTTPLTNPTTLGTTATVGVDGFGNLCSIVNGVYTIGIWVSSGGYGPPTHYFVLQVFGAGIVGQQLIPCSVPSGGGGGS